MRCVAEVSSFNLMYNLCMYYERQKSYDKTELTFQPTLVHTLFPIYDTPGCSVHNYVVDLLAHPIVSQQSCYKKMSYHSLSPSLYKKL